MHSNELIILVFKVQKSSLPEIISNKNSNAPLISKDVNFNRKTNLQYM